MPPPGGPLIGSGMKLMIAEAAIEADMEHRGFRHFGDGLFKESGSNGNDSAPVVWQVLIRDGSVEIDMLYGSDSNSSVPSPADYAYLQADVFDRWPQEIDDAFAHWEDFPEASGLEAELSGVIRGASEIRVDEDSSGLTAEGSTRNTRLVSDIDNLKGRGRFLNGLYAEAFIDNYVSKLEPTLANLHGLTMVAGIACKGEAELFSRTRTQLGQLCNDAHMAMKSSGPRGGDSTGLRFALIIVGAIAAGVGIVSTAGLATVPTAALVGGALTSTGAGAAGGVLGLLDQPETPEDLPLGAGHPDDVLANLLAALEQLNSSFKNEERNLERFLEAAAGDAAPDPDGNAFDIETPDVVGGTGQDVLETQQDELHVDDATIARITELWIPSINGDIRAACAALDAPTYAWQRPATIGIGSGVGPHGAYRDFLEALKDRMLDVERELQGAADSLQAAAALIGLSDEQTNQQFAAEAAEIERVNDNA
ncbi:hypothetical protein [Nocardioides nanhaiensis]|uniref:WXG100 family type VII secretion target n=1 Tax=Nocardioides nanhaiensis TaxID=1476871 RepID=A0ABP8X1Y7_9ACTN